MQVLVQSDALHQLITNFVIGQVAGVAVCHPGREFLEGHVGHAVKQLVLVAVLKARRHVGHSRVF